MLKILMAATLLSTLTATAEELNLAGQWLLTGTDESEAAISCPVDVPGGVHSALLRAGKIPHPFFGRNELKTQWVGRHDWTVSRTFEVDDALLARKAIVLRLDNVDTFATIRLNGHELGRTDNRFRRWTFDVKPFLKKGTNEIRGEFASVERLLPGLRQQYPGRDFPMSCGDTRWIPSLALVRKPACHCGWDWGLSQMITGFCGETRLVAYDDFRIDDVTCEQKFNDDLSRCDLAVKVFCTDADGRAFVETRQVAIDQPPLWWPNGAGERKFYNLSIDIRGHRVTRRLGLRKIEVLNTPDKDENGKPGARLAFRVNGRELFMKGADWIPCSAFENEQTPARYRDLVASAAAANMNMLRLWGGGQYEKDAFYDACDELGILVWHDFMFSCAIYPGDDAFLKTVRAEAIDQVRRLHDRPSIALWCGDNECVGALNWWEAPRQNREYYRGELEKRFRVLSEVLAQEDPGRMFWPSSPCGGPGNYNDNWHDDSFGDMHNWTVWHENRSFDNYYTFRPRFCSEFGYQSFSSREVAETFCPPDHLNPTAPDFEWHQKNPGGNQRMLETMARYFRFPQGTDAMLYLSQVQQAMAIKTAVEGWRALRPRCMGTLFWQLNDNWPVASWSSVEYGGKWKHLQHHARRFYAPLAVVGLPGNRLAALNDTAKDVAAEIIVEEWAFDGTAPVKSTTFSRTLKADGVEIISNVSHAAGNFLVLRLRTADGEFTNEWLSDRYKDHDLAAAKINVAFDGLKVTLTTDRPAFFVWANVKGVRGEFDDNSFTLLPGRPKTLTFAAKENGLTPEKLRAAFSLTHLRETY